jgi:hypothetical protein
MSDEVKSFSEWIISDTIGIVVLTSLTAMTAQNALFGLRTMVINKALAGQSDYVYNHLRNNIEYNYNNNNNAASAFVLKTSVSDENNSNNNDNITNRNSNNHSNNINTFNHINQSQEAYFNYPPNPHIFWSIVVIVTQVLFSLLLAYMIYIFLCRIGMKRMKIVNDSSSSSDTINKNQSSNFRQGNPNLADGVSDEGTKY